MVKRQITNLIAANLHKGKAIILLGARQCGKTTLLKELCPDATDTIYLNCDDLDDRHALETGTITGLRNLIGKKKYLLIDEAQRVPDIGIKLKMVVDNFPDTQLIATGSSSFELSNRINEPLTGRKYEYHLHPFSYQELTDHFGIYQESKLLNTRIIYGSYPDIVNHPSEQQELLNQLVGSYLYKDIFSFQDLRKPEVLDKLLRALALQISAEVSYTELSQLVNVDHSTIQRYIQLLESAYIIFRLPNYSSNQRNEIKRSRKFYFWDTGIRNCLIDDFRPLEMRDDLGKLWENYIVAERLKMLSNARIYRNSFFWRNVNNAEIDYLELYENQMEGFEVKWNPKRKLRAQAFLKAYPHARLNRVSKENYHGFLTVG